MRALLAEPLPCVFPMTRIRRSIHVRVLTALSVLIIFMPGVAWPVSLGWGDVGCGANDEHVLSSLNADAPWSGGDLSYAKST